MKDDSYRQKPKSCKRRHDALVLDWPSGPGNRRWEPNYSRGLGNQQLIQQKDRNRRASMAQPKREAKEWIEYSKNSLEWRNYKVVTKKN